MNTKVNLMDFNFEDHHQELLDEESLAAEADGGLSYKVAGRWVRDDEAPTRVRISRRQESFSHRVRGR